MLLNGVIIVFCLNDGLCVMNIVCIEGSVLL